MAELNKLSENVGLIAIDDGGSTTCVVTKQTQEKFYSVKGVYGERNLTNAVGKHDFIVDYKNEKYVMGTLAKYDCTMPIEMHTRSKQNIFYDLSVLVAIHQYGYINNNVVLSVPIKMHNDEEKSGRLDRLKGVHTITVNNKTKTFFINDVKIAPETAVAYWVEEPKGKTRFIDLGSRTIGYATTINQDGVNRFIDTESGTFFGKGLEALEGQYSTLGLADFICGRLSKMWSKDDTVYLLGGGTLDTELTGRIKEYFPKATEMREPQMSNVIGMYNLGRKAYGTD